MAKIKDYIEYKGQDSGVRTTFSGKLYVDKKVFFQREDVKRVLKEVMDSKVLKAHIATNKK